MVGQKVLVVDDEPTLVEVLRIWLEEAGYTVIDAPDGQQGLRAFFAHQPALAIVDVLMPRMDGFELLRRIREVSDVPVVILSAKGTEADKVSGLAFGADDYLVKPIGRAEMIARVEAAMRRASRTSDHQNEEHYSDGVISIDFRRHDVYFQGEPVELTPTEHRLLITLVRNAGRVLTHDQLLRQIWGPEFEGSGYVKWHISRLRQKIERDPARPELVVTVRGVGYRYQRVLRRIQNSPFRRRHGPQPGGYGHRVSGFRRWHLGGNHSG